MSPPLLVEEDILIPLPFVLDEVKGKLKMGSVETVFL
jgi:hypothetical protein